MSDNVIDIITRQVVEKVGDELETRVQLAISSTATRIEDEAQRRINAAVAEIPKIALNAAQQSATSWGVEERVLDTQPDVKSDAKDRAWRTLVQGLVVTLVLSVITAFGTAVSAPGFDLLTWDSWKAAATAGGTAAVMSVAAYIQRLISPPKVENRTVPRA